LNPLLQPVRRLLNALGVDLIPYDPSRRRRPPTRANKPSVPERIVISGGDRDYGPDWHNIEFVTAGYADKYKSLPRNIDISHDLTAGKSFPISDDTLVAAYTSHVIEHLKDEHVLFLLKDAHRALKPGGYLRLSTPDIDLYGRAFLEKDLDFFHYRNHPHYARLGIRNSLAGLFLDVFATRIGEQPQKLGYAEVRATIERLGLEGALEHYAEQAPYDYARSHYHVNWFNARKLTAMCRQAGFSEVYVSALGQSHCPEMRDLTVFDMGDPKISLFVECRKQ
jgi:predicted SAM-dependent methyltransferase